MSDLFTLEVRFEAVKIGTTFLLQNGAAYYKTASGQGTKVNGLDAGDIIEMRPFEKVWIDPIDRPESE